MKCADFNQLIKNVIGTLEIEISVFQKKVYDVYIEN